MPEVGQIIETTKAVPWYVLLAGGLFGAVLLGGYIKRYLSKEGVAAADDRATINSIDLYKSIVNELREQHKLEMEARKASEAKYDELLRNYAALTGEIAALRLTTTAQTEQIARQESIIADLRDQVASLRSQYVST